MYLTNNGSVRVGYIDGSKMKDHLTLPKLSFTRTQVTCLETTVNGQVVRGFVKADILDLMDVEMENEDAGEMK